MGNQAAIEEQSRAFEVEKRGSRPLTRKQKMVKKVQRKFRCFQRGGAAINVQTTVSDKDVADLVSDVTRTSSCTFDVEGQADSPAPRGPPPANVDAFTLAD